MTRQNIRYRILTIPGKVALILRISVDTRSEFRSVSDTAENIGLTLYPNIELQVLRPRPLDETGNPVRVWNPNDTLSLTKFTLPAFLKDFNHVYDSLKMTEMYVYTGDRLDLNSKLAEEQKRIFQASQTMFVEIIPTVLDLNGKRMEGVRFTFNKEPSTFSLTLDEVDALIFNLKNLNPDLVALNLFQIYVKSGQTTINNPFPPM